MKPTGKSNNCSVKPTETCNDGIGMNEVGSMGCMVDGWARTRMSFFQNFNGRFGHHGQ